MERRQKRRQYFPYSLPKSAKNRTQEPAQAGLPQKSACQKAQCVAEFDIAAANAEAQLQPGRKAGQHKYAVPQDPGPEETQEAVQQTQSRPKTQGPQKALGIQGRTRHLNRRRRPPTGRFSS